MAKDDDQNIVAVLILVTGAIALFLKFRGARGNADPGKDIIRVPPSQSNGDGFFDLGQWLWGDIQTDTIETVPDFESEFADDFGIKTNPIDQQPVTLNDLYRDAGARWGIDWQLLKAIAQVESGERPFIKNPNDPSYGLMQILCTGPEDGNPCRNNFNINDWEIATHELLFDPKWNLHYAAQILKWNLETYGWPKGIAVYNNWGARNDPESGPFRNQGYVDKVTTALSGIRGDGGAFQFT